MLKSKSFEAEEEKVIIVGSIDSCSKCRKEKKTCNHLVRCLVKIREEVLVRKAHLLCTPTAIAKFDLID